MSLISIITTTYNHQKFIAETIESVLHQTFSNRELLIGDDSPNNETWDIIGNYIKKYPQKIRARHHSPSKHIVGNLNFLIAQANKNSKYIAFLEGDDLRHPDYLKEKIKNVVSCFRISIIQTFIIGFSSLWYRMLKPAFYLFLQKRGKKSRS